MKYDQEGGVKFLNQMWFKQLSPVLSMAFTLTCIITLCMRKKKIRDFVAEKPF